MQAGRGGRRWRARAMPGVLSLVMLVSGLAGCSGSADPAAKSVTVAVSASRAVHVTVPGVATVSGSAGSVRGTGKISVMAVRPPLPFGGALQSAGTGIDIRFSGVRLVRPLTIRFATVGRPPAGTVPVVAHRESDGAWDLSLASRDSPGRLSVRTMAFSPHVPAYLHPSVWVHWLGDRLASLIGGRTARITVPAAARRGPAC